MLMDVTKSFCFLFFDSVLVVVAVEVVVIVVAAATVVVPLLHGYLLLCCACSFYIICISAKYQAAEWYVDWFVLMQLTCFSGQLHCHLLRAFRCHNPLATKKDVDG